MSDTIRLTNRDMNALPGTTGSATDSKKQSQSQLHDFNENDLMAELEDNKSAQFAIEKLNYLATYYQRCFPYKRIFNWLNYQPVTQLRNTVNKPNTDYFHKREISYMILTSSGEEVCIRHECYNSKDEFKKGVQSRTPIRIDVGPVCDIPPIKAKDSTSRKPTAIEREFVIDIDMTDYDNIRTCCKGKHICKSCWKYLTAAHKVLKRALEEDLGFEHILWVFSGRRGIHAWVCDERARIMDNSVRGAITDMLDLTEDNERVDNLVKARVLSNQEHPLIKKSYEILEPLFEEFMIKEQCYLSIPKNFDLFFKLVNMTLDRQPERTSSLKGALQQKIAQLRDELIDLQDTLDLRHDGTLDIDKAVANGAGPRFSEKVYQETLKFFEKNRLPDLQKDFMLELVIGLMYPKIDAHVSAQTNHLLKCPFNIHHSTGLVSIPIGNFDTFELDEVPFVQDVIEGSKEGGEKNQHPVYQQAVDYFDAFSDELFEEAAEIETLEKKRTVAEDGRMVEEEPDDF